MRVKTISVFGLGAAALFLSCRGGGSPEETWETFNGHMAAKEFARAAAAVYDNDWAGLPPAALTARRAAYATVLADEYVRDDLDYGRGELRERVKVGPDAVELSVAYPRRSRPATATLYRLRFGRVDGVWYYLPPAEMLSSRGG